MATRASAARNLIFAWAAALAALAAPPAASQPALAGWDQDAREFFVKSCIHGMSAGQIRDYELAHGKAAPAQTVAAIERQLAAPCGCIQKKAAAKWQFLEFANNQPRLQGELQAIARECMPRK